MARKKKKADIYAFIDSQNLNLGIKSQGWDLDWRKFRQYLRNKYSVEKAFLFIGYVPGNEGLYTSLQENGYLLIFKPTMELPEGKVKGNVDAELVLHTMPELKNYKKAIIVTGDGDFHCLMEQLEKEEKLLHIMTPNKRYSKLFKPFAKYIVKMNSLRKSLEQKNKKTGISGRSKP